ncbi:MAG: gamma-glutamyl-gamma-aminobutyrate hydrolase family protein [Planctomycetes bacterium]|nr:gamma-glutamyl-gamma-aminobutyrate hydrolase family protein [Planctomycetota bacterium]
MPADSRVLIGLTTEVLDTPWYEGRRRYQLFTDYSACLREAGAIPVLIPGDTPAADLPRILDGLDGVLTTGGDDADLRAFGGPAPTPECKPVPLEQQGMNLGLTCLVLERDMPLLAVCFGMQMMGLTQDAGFDQHIATHADHGKGIKHAVRLESDSKMAEIIGSTEFSVPSFHHQALTDTGKPEGALVPGGMRAVGWAPDGTLEAIEVPTATFALGVQWHPERAPDSDASRALFSRFVAAAVAYRSLQTA